MHKYKITFTDLSFTDYKIYNKYDQYKRSRFTEKEIKLYKPTVLIPSLADKIGPIVEPQGLSFRTANSWKSIYRKLIKMFSIAIVSWQKNPGYSGWRYLPPGLFTPSFLSATRELQLENLVPALKVN